MHRILWLFFYVSCLAQTTEMLYLSGTDKDHTVWWDFYCTAGRNSGVWSKIAVPSNWELQGFGHFCYGRDDVLTDEIGHYRYHFHVPNEWQDKIVYIVFEGAMTDTEVRINGRSAGPRHQGGFYRFRYPVTSLLRFDGENTLEVTVSKASANASVNEAERTADYWVFGGIFRPVYLQAFPAEHIDHVAIDARSDGSFSINVFPVVKKGNRQISLQLEKDGQLLPYTWSIAASKQTIEGKLDNPALWSPEFPHLYTAILRLTDGAKVLHTLSEKFGFRSIEIRERDGIYINGKKIMFRGVCRHSFWPESGRTTSQALSIQDVSLMKEMNMNAVRMSHYPPDVHFLDACDSLGLYVIDELAGWQYPPYDTDVGRKLVAEMVWRDVNHPSIVFWANGNEGGFNYELDAEFEKYDPQKRRVIHPWENFHGLNTFHYFPYDYGIQDVFHGKDIFFPTEILHGLYDGGAGAGLEDYWQLMLGHPLSAGAFLWVFCDEGVLRRDLHDSIDTRGNMGPDGILGPYREKEASFYTIKDIWSPIQFTKKMITDRFDGTFEIENRFDDTHLGQCTFTCEWLRYDGFFPNLTAQKQTLALASPNIAPKQSGKLQIPLPENWRANDVLYISAYDPYGRHIQRWSWNLSSPDFWSRKHIAPGTAPVTGKDNGTTITLSSAEVTIVFAKESGRISKVVKNNRSLPLSNGPVFVGIEPVLQKVQLSPAGEGWAVEWLFADPPPAHIKWTMLPGGICCLEYDYRPPAGGYDLLGITFSFPESLVTGAKLLANGPYRVWKNRLRGTLFGLYEKKYNDTVTGQSWDYPEFKGYYANFYAVELQTQLGSFSIISASEDLFLHLFTPKAPQAAPNNRTLPIFPDGDLSFLHTITPIGNKSHPAEWTGPQGWPSRYQPNRNSRNLSGKLYFIF